MRWIYFATVEQRTPLSCLFEFAAAHHDDDVFTGKTVNNDAVSLALLAISEELLGLAVSFHKFRRFTTH